MNTWELKSRLVDTSKKAITPTINAQNIRLLVINLYLIINVRMFIILYLKKKNGIKNKIILTHKSSRKITTGHASYMYCLCFYSTNYRLPSPDIISWTLSYLMEYLKTILISAKYFIINKYHNLLMAYTFVGCVGSFHFLILSPDLFVYKYLSAYY